MLWLRGKFYEIDPITLDFVVELKDLGIELRGRDALILVVSEERLKEILDKHKKRLEDIVVRELVRLQRIKGLQIEDERAKTYFLQSIGYFLRLEYEKDELKKLLEEWKHKIFIDIDEFVRLFTRLIGIRWVILDIKDDETFRTIFKEEEIGIKIEYEKTLTTLEYKIEIKIRGLKRTYTKRVVAFEMSELARSIIEDALSLIEHVELSLLGKIMSGK